MNTQHNAHSVYRASSVQGALAAVKRELGPDAVIVETRNHGRQVEVIARRGGDTRPAAAGRSSADTRLLQQRLTRMGVPEDAAELLAGRLRSRRGSVPAGLAGAKKDLSVVLGDELVFGGPLTGRPRTVALVGPTGVGKTTTIAKLAAQASLVERLQVGLVCLDDYRIGGAEQLHRYAELIGVPMITASSRKDLRSALRKLKGKQLVLVDTAGRSPHDIAALEESAETLHGADEAIEVHLCTAAATSDVELRAIVARHKILQPHRLLITKVDEAVYHGGIIAAQALAALPYSYFTTGQRVPEDIEVASARRLAALLCGEEVHA